MTRPEASLPPSNASGLILVRHLSTGFFACHRQPPVQTSTSSYTATYRTSVEVDTYIMQLVSVAAGVAILAVRTRLDRRAGRPDQ
jgi:hypothetical protein